MVLEQSISNLNQMAQKRGVPFKVLIIDDEQWVREIFRDFCGITGAVDVELAKGGVDAIEKARTNSYDMITLDLIMPEMSGLDVLSEIKRISPKVPVWVITGNATDRLIHEAGILGASKVMYKPVVLEEFLAELAAVFAGK
ncbi:MAG TPA: response regulator [candidate division Zixibacteria bacterium]|nr:response regulator [candidate division Zixibacteria bacterium]